jgi:hypothetical protein
MPFQCTYHAAIVKKDFKCMSTSQNSVIQTLFSSDSLVISGDPMIESFFSSHLSRIHILCMSNIKVGTQVQISKPTKI